MVYNSRVNLKTKFATSSKAKETHGVYTERNECVRLRRRAAKIAVGLSGGVDSSVTAYLLKNQGYDVTGIHMVCWNERTVGCTQNEDRADAARAAAHLGIKFEVLNFVKEYKEKVIDYFYSEYRAGRTPNPDIVCNKEIKFGMFLDWAVTQGFDYIATGHYARVSEKDGAYSLLKGMDGSKDQSYFLYRLGQNQLKRTLFPLGNKNKSDVRNIAQKVGLHNASKPDSFGICFVGEVNIKKFLERKIKIKKGNVIDKEGNIVGEHDGMAFYTIGQRHGYKLNKYFSLPTYVVAKNPEKNEIIIGYAGDVNKKVFSMTDMSFIGSIPKSDFECDVRVRHLGELFRARISYSDLISDVTCENPIFGVAPGQSAVLYQKDLVLGGGIISSARV